MCGNSFQIYVRWEVPKCSSIIVGESLLRLVTTRTYYNSASGTQDQSLSLWMPRDAIPHVGANCSNSGVSEFYIFRHPEEAKKVALTLVSLYGESRTRDLVFDIDGNNAFDG